MTETPLDRAHAAMEAAPGDEAARLGFYERLADGELFLLLAAEPDGGAVEPEIFETAEGHFVLVFDRVERLAAFTGRSAPYAALSGRAVTDMLAGQGLGLGVNLGVASSAILIPPEAVGWLAETLGARPRELAEKPETLAPPAGLPERLVAGLDVKLAASAGLARMAYLASVTYRGGRRAHLLALIDPVPGANEALARAVGEALIFSGLDAGELDVAFFRAADPVSARLAKVGLRFDLPEARTAEAPRAPGTDPARPPKLK